jgi:hypothetical protein
MHLEIWTRCSGGIDMLCCAILFSAVLDAVICYLWWAVLHYVVLCCVVGECVLLLSRIDHRRRLRSYPSSQKWERHECSSPWSDLLCSALLYFYLIFDLHWKTDIICFTVSASYRNTERSTEQSCSRLALGSLHSRTFSQTGILGYLSQSHTSWQSSANMNNLHPCSLPHFILFL